MSAGVDIRSIIPSAHTKLGPLPLEIQQRYRKPDLEAICKTFGWSEPPWQDPSDVSGLDTSIGYGRYSLFLSLAWAIGELDDDPSSNIKGLIETVEQTHRSKPEHRYAELQHNCKVFPHLLVPNFNYISYYLPTAVPYPIYLITPSPAAKDDIAQPFSVGSSIQLLREVEMLAPRMKRIVSIRGEDTQIPNSNQTWGGVEDVCLTLLHAAKDSLELNLPIHIG